MLAKMSDRDSNRRPSRNCAERGGLRPLPRAGKAALRSYSVAPASRRS